MKRPKCVFLFLAGSESVYLYVCLRLFIYFDSINDRHDRGHKDRAGSIRIYHEVPVKARVRWLPRQYDMIKPWLRKELKSEG